MRGASWASLRTHLRRYVAAAGAVTVSVTFVVVVGVLAAGARSGLMAGMGAPFRNADHVVDGMDTTDAIALAERLGAHASVVGRASVTVRVGGRRLDRTTVGVIAPVEELRWQKLVAGRFPARDGEAVVHLPLALAEEIAVGDRVRIGDGAAARDVTVVGLVESPSVLAMASVYVTWHQVLRWRDDLDLRAVVVRGDPGPLPEGAKVRSPERYVLKLQTELTRRVDTLSVTLLLFAAVALFGSVLVVANTFAIVLAGRLRDFALLRCVGATRRQVVRAVRREAATVGTVASLAGVLVGLGLGYGVIAVVNAVAPTAPLGFAAPSTRWLLGGFAVGVAATMIASWLPTRRVVRVSPLAALRPDTAVDVHTAAGRVRLTLAAFFLIAGLAALGAAMARNSVELMLAGGGALFTGVLLFGPIVVPRLIRVIGAPLGPIGRLAAENAVRNPRRTATTTASLLVGVTLTTAVLTGMATTRAAVNEKLHKLHPVDFALTSPHRPVTTDLLDQVRRTPGVARAIAVAGAVARVTALDEPIPVVAAPDAARVANDGGAFARVAPGTIALDRDAFDEDVRIRSGDRVMVRVGDRQAALLVTLGTGWGRSGLVAAETLATLTDAPEPHAIWIRAASGTDPTRLSDDLDELADPIGANVKFRPHGSVDQQLALLTWSAVGLLGITGVIALIGIANTLSLSVLERTREHALLRALGLTRRQLRRMLAAEAVLLSIVATGLGTGLGVTFAWVGHETFVTQALPDATLRIPWLQLGAVALAAALAGLLASVLPARRAAHVTPAAGLTFD